ncbi:MAG: 3-oxoacyl-[acyl-carrier-protein] reductase [Clostridiales bacterium]|nr:3-oxoacyl-[acyl-carrier-protein] reductase [Clostridiales bacterium]
MLKGKTAVITGASRGIGAAAAVKFAALGADIAIVYAGNTDGAQRVKEDCIKYGVKAEIFQCDVSDHGKAKELVSQVKSVFGRIDILINNAGITRDGLAMVMKEADFDDVIDTNLKGSFNMIKMCLPVMLKSKGGKIINISSVVGINGNAGQANYASSKAGLIGLTKSIAKEMASKNITCNAIAPGYIETDMTKDMETSDPLVSSIPMKRPGRPEDVAAAAAFLASSAADYITGEVIRVDGGLAI